MGTSSRAAARGSRFCRLKASIGSMAIHFLGRCAHSECCSAPAQPGFVSKVMIPQPIRTGAVEADAWDGAPPIQRTAIEIGKSDWFMSTFHRMRAGSWRD
jgi:hypothetical protein